MEAYRHFHALSANQLHAAHDIFLHLDELRQLLSQIGPESTCSSLAEGMTYCINVSGSRDKAQAVLPKLLLPNRRPPLVEDEGGGGFSIWEAVGARDWRIEYVRCILV